MRIIVKAKPLTKKEKIERLNQPRLNIENEEAELDVYKIWVKEPPIGGQANEAITKALAKHFNISSSKVILISGDFSKQKIFDILI